MFLFVAGCLIVSGLQPFGLVSFHDPAPVHTPQGIDHAGKDTKRSAMQVSLLPYHLHAASAKNSSHEKTALGDRLGPINMLALLINDDVSPYEKKFGSEASTSESVLHAAYDGLADHIAGTGDAEEAHPDDSIFLGATYEPVSATDSRYGWGKYLTTMKHSRIGLRGSFDYSFANGIGVTIKSGIAQYSLNPAYTANPFYDVSLSKWINHADVSADGTAVKVMQSKLMASTRHEAVGKMLGVDFSGSSTTSIEDTSVEVSWRRGYVMRDEEGDKVVTTTPYFAIGVTLPTAEKKNASKLFDLALGNDGFYGFSAQGELSFDFPGMIRFGFGAAVTLYNQDTIGKQFVPTSEYQETLYPWKTTVTKRPGTLWKAYATIKAHHFIDYMSCYVNYILVAHEKDSITLSGSEASLFLPKNLGLTVNITLNCFILGLTMR